MTFTPYNIQIPFPFILGTYLDHKIFFNSNRLDLKFDNCLTVREELSMYALLTLKRSQLKGSIFMNHAKLVTFIGCSGLSLPLSLSKR